MRLSFAISVAALALSLAVPTVVEAGDARAEIRALLDRYVQAVAARDIDAIMNLYVPNKSLLVFDVLVPRQYAGAAAYRKDWRDFLDSFAGPISAIVTDLEIVAGSNLAYSHDIEHWLGTDRKGGKVDVTVRVTDVYRKIKGRWLIVHEHNSVPVDLETGKADLNSKP